MHPLRFPRWASQRCPKLRRLLPFVFLAGLTACGNSPPPPQQQSFAPLNYDYLPPILLNVANLTVQNNYVPDPGAATLIGEDPDPPANALTRMLQHRLVADGAPGSGTVTIEDASIEQVGDSYVGLMTVRLDVASPDGRRTGYTEASVTVTQSAPGPDADPGAVQAALYGVSKQLMEAMNVQLQYQIQRNMGNWVSYGGSAAAAPLGAPANGGIEATPLGTPAAGAPPSPTPAGAPEPLAPQLPVPPAAAGPSATPPAPGYAPVPLQTNGLPLGSHTLGTLPVTPVAPEAAPGVAPGSAQY